MSIWVVPAGTDDIGGAGDGDLLVRADGEELHVARIVSGSVEWLGGAPVDTIALPDVDAPTPAPDDIAEELEGFAEALVARGG
jgi:hypothetical protein